MSILYEGILKKDGRPFYVRHLTINDLNTILKVQERVVQTLQDKDQLQPLSESEFQEIIEGKGLVIGAFAEDSLVAFRALLVPPLDGEHLGRDIGLAEEELPKVIYQEISNVLPEFRGNSLQKLLASIIMDEVGRQNHSYRYVLCTVAPFNIPSLKDKFSQGMEIAGLKEKYGGRLRCIFVKDLLVSEKGEGSPQEKTVIKMCDIDLQKQMLSDGWRGIDLEEIDGEYWVHYRR